ncbi:MAG: class IV adenylate cyclase [Planctomycetota bacterium]
MLEVELKFPVDDLAVVRERLATLGGAPAAAVEQADAYYNHPSRDFAQTDEALRIRTNDDASFVTYKGPKRGGVTKTRREIELPLAGGDRDGWAEILTSLGFAHVATVKKHRTPFALTYDGRSAEVTLDEVDGVGTYVEIETIASGDDDLKAAEACVAAVAWELGLSAPERRSYLEMLLATEA